MASNNLPSFDPSFFAARLLGWNASRATQSLKRLSSGLRINSAADDPAGLYSAERLRARYRGYTRASQNALDGISAMQTADSSLTEIGSLLQNIRELAVSASDGTKTASDRAAIQDEVSGYIAEIDRIASVSEFNTKSLLDGSLGALISTSDYSRLRGVVTGDVGRGGQFLVQARIRDAGALQHVVSDVFTLTGSGDMAGPVSGITTQQGQVELVTDTGSGTGNTGVYVLEVPNTTNGGTFVSGMVSSGVRARLSVTALSLASLAAGGVSFSELFQAENITAGDKLIFGFNEISIFTNISITISAARDIGAFITSLNTEMGANATVTGQDTGVIRLSLAAGAQLTGVQFVDSDNSGSVFNISLDATTGVVETNVLHDGVSVTLTNNASTASVLLRKSDISGVLSVGDANTGAVHLRFDPNADYSATGIVSMTDYLSVGTTGGGNSFEDYTNVSMISTAVTSGSYLLSAVSETTYAIYAFDNSRYSSLVNSGTDQDLAVLMAKGARFHVDGAPASNTFTVGQHIEGEDLDDGSATNALTAVRLTVTGGILASGERAVFDVAATNTTRAGATTTLASIDAFSSSGLFSGVTSRSLDIYFNGRDGRATVDLLASDTLADAAGKISLAIYSPQGGGLIDGAGIVDDYSPPDIVKFNATGDARGTLSIVSPRPGDEIVLAGDDDLITALGFDTTTAAESPEYSLTAFDAVTGERITSVRTRDDYADGLIRGVRVYFDNSMNMSLDPEPNSANTNTAFPYYTPDEMPAISITNPADVNDMYVHVAPSPYQAQVGAGTGDSFRIVIPTVSAETLGVRGLNVATEDRANAAIGTVDQAIGRLNRIQSNVGAYQNRLESASRTLDVAAENTLAAESRIRNTDYAREMIELARSQMLTSSAGFALVQANLQAKSVLNLLAA